MRELSTTIDIEAPPATVWAVLTDFGRYPEWNPFVRVVGRPNEGARLAVEVTPPGKRAFRFRPTVTSVQRDRELRWLGHLSVPGLYDGEHRFTLDATEAGTRLTHAESFGGVLAGLVGRFLGDATEAGFREMSAALKARAESLAAEPTRATSPKRVHGGDSGDELTA